MINILVTQTVKPCYNFKNVFIYEPFLNDSFADLFQFHLFNEGFIYLVVSSFLKTCLFLLSNCISINELFLKDLQDPLCLNFFKSLFQDVCERPVVLSRIHTDLTDKLLIFDLSLCQFSAR